MTTPHFRGIAPFLLLLVAACAPAAPSADGAGTICTFTNPLGPGQDPWVAQHENRYHYIESRGGGLWVYDSDSLTDPKRDGVQVWAAPDTGWNRATVWAPELHRIDDRWFIYYAAGRSGPPFIHQRSGVLRSLADDPRGQYEDLGMLYTGDDVAAGTNAKWAIDLTTLVIDGQRYAIWSGWEENRDTDRTPQHLYIAPMENPWTISGNRVLLSSPVESWERGTELDLAEGPQVLQRDGDTFIIYSTRESWLPDYRLGQLRLRRGADPLNPESWEKSGPVFTRTDEVFGPGHNGFASSPDGSEDWILYHAKADTTPGWNRVLRMQPFTWRDDGSPDFGSPVPAGQPMPVPSGQDCG